MKAINIQTEYLTNPIGIDILHPRILWNCDGEGKQSAFSIIFKKDENVIFETGKIDSSSMHYDYPNDLSSRDRIAFKITLFNEKGESEESEECFFEVGLLNKSDWKAKWISGNYHVNKKKRYPVDCFLKEFEANKIRFARLYASACGVYEAKLNGQRVGDFILAPGSTDYRKRIQYQTYDITSLLKEGKNSLEVELADGWYRGSSGAKGRVNTYGKQTKFILQIEMVDDEGKLHYVCSDSSFSWSDDGPIEFADLKDGEIVDLNKKPSYAHKAKEVKFEANLTSSNNYFVKEEEHFHPLEMFKSPSGKTILKFPQNISGYISFFIKAKKGQQISIRLGEMLDENGELTLGNIQCIHKGKRTPLQELHIKTKGGLNEYKPKFFYGGFQYAEIDTDIPFEKDDFESIAVYSDFKQTGFFECSNEMINKFYSNTLWSLKSNSTDLPSDCPTRERMGWTGDSQIFFNTASYMVSYAPFARKHVQDIFDRQWKSGRLPQIAPFANEDWFMWTMNGSVGWACAGVYIPLFYYQKYGDIRILEKYYPQMLKYADFMIKRAGKWGGVYAKHVPMSRKNRKYFVNAGQSYGEWAEPSDVCAFKWYDFAAPHPEESTAYTYFTLKRVLEVSKILGKKKDKHLEKIEEYSEGAKRAYQELITKKGFSLDTNRQAKLVRPLYMGLLDSKDEEFAKKRLIKALDNYSWRIGTGFLSTPYILSVLEKMDVEYAYKLLLNEEMPGWLYMVKKGASTIWESWEGNSTPDRGIASLNHYSKGALCEWLFSSMLGIKITGENSIEINPKVGGNITYAKGSYQSIYGLITSSWERNGDNVKFTICVPSNVRAKIVLLGINEVVIGGAHTYEIKM